MRLKVLHNEATAVDDQNSGHVLRRKRKMIKHIGTEWESKMGIKDF